MKIHLLFMNVIKKVKCYKKIRQHNIEKNEKYIKKVCEKCGKEFTISKKGKRNICEECYRVLYREKDRLRKIPKEKVHQ